MRNADLRFTTAIIPRILPFPKVYIDRMTYGLVRIEIENGITYRYLPALCIDGHVELYDEYGKIFYESTTDGLTRMLVLNAVDGTDIVFSSYNSFTHIP